MAKPADHEKRFQVYFNYLTSIGDFLSSYDNEPDSLYIDVVNSRAFKAVQGGRFHESEAEVGRYLRLAWLTECNLWAAGQNAEYVGFSNLWSPVQVYYGFYLTLRSYFHASNQTVSDHHSASLNHIAQLIVDRPLLFGYPWRLLCKGNPKTPSFINLPPNVTLQKISPLASNQGVDFWDRYAMFLKTTHERTFDELCSEWKSKQKKKSMKVASKQSIIDGMRPTTLFDCLYRLRIRSNYIDADTFIFSKHSSDEAQEFHDALVNIFWYTQFSFELLIARCVGKRNYRTVVESFQTSQTEVIFSETVGRRWDIINHMF